MPAARRCIPACRCRNRHSSGNRRHMSGRGPARNSKGTCCLLIVAAGVSCPAAGGESFFSLRSIRRTGTSLRAGSRVGITRIAHDGGLETVPGVCRLRLLPTGRTRRYPPGTGYSCWDRTSVWLPLPGRNSIPAGRPGVVVRDLVAVERYPLLPRSLRSRATVLYPQGVWLLSHRSVRPLSFASSSEIQAQPSGQTGVDPCFTQYFGTWFAASALRVRSSHSRTDLPGTG